MNSNYLVLSIICLFLTTTSFAGGGIGFKNLKLKKVGIHYGAEQDLTMGNKMSHQYFSSIVKDARITSDIASDVHANYYKHSGVCENPHLQVDLAFKLPNPNRELQFQLMSIFNRVDGISYNRASEATGPEFLNYDLYSSEFALQANYAFKKELNIIKNVLGINFYGLGGANIGYQFNNELFVSGSTDLRDRQLGVRMLADGIDNARIDFDSVESFQNNYNASNAINQRAYVGGGIGVVFFNRLEVGMNGKFGYGYRYHFSNDFATTNIRSFDFSAKWVLK